MASQLIERFPSPADASPRWQSLRLQLPDGKTIVAKDDEYSDRIRCDHPGPCDPQSLVLELVQAARARGRDRVVLLAPAAYRNEIRWRGMVLEATMPGFYRGTEDCDVWRYALTPRRASEAEPEAVAAVEAIVAQAKPAGPRAMVATERATPDDAAGIAALVAASFEHYPTPTGVPEYVASQIEEGTPFRIVRDGTEIVACASADRVVEARTAELTDCATRPDQRGRGLMQALLAGLMDDLREMDYPTAFTLARASVPGINLAFQRLGFEFRGRMAASCRIGGGIEDMNVWSRRL